jgi:hypothetical protein
MAQNGPVAGEAGTPLVRDTHETGTRHVLATYEPPTGIGQLGEETLWVQHSAGHRSEVRGRRS